MTTALSRGLGVGRIVFYGHHEARLLLAALLFCSREGPACILFTMTLFGEAGGVLTALERRKQDARAFALQEASDLWCSLGIFDVAHRVAKQRSKFIC